MKRATIKTTLGMVAVASLVMAGVGACGDTSAPATPTTQAQPTPTVVLKEPTAAPTENTSNGWQTFTSEADGFAVDMPGEPRASTRTTDSPLGEVTFHFFQLSDGEGQLAVSYNDYPVAAEDLDPEQLLTNAIDGATQGSTVQNMQTVNVQGHTGIEGEINGQGITHVWYRGILVRARLYNLIFTAPEANKADFDDEARRFIDSFRLLNP